MTRVFALFDDDAKLQDAQDALERSGMTADIERVIDGSVPADIAAAPLIGGVVSPIATNGRPHGAAAVGLGRNWLSEFGLDDEEAAFLRDSVDNGASLIIVRTERPDDARSILSDTGGSRVFHKD